MNPTSWKVAMTCKKAPSDIGRLHLLGSGATAAAAVAVAVAAMALDGGMENGLVAGAATAAAGLEFDEEDVDGDGWSQGDPREILEPTFGSGSLQQQQQQQQHRELLHPHPQQLQPQQNGMAEAAAADGGILPDMPGMVSQRMMELDGELAAMAAAAGVQGNVDEVIARAMGVLPLAPLDGSFSAIRADLDDGMVTLSGQRTTLEDDLALITSHRGNLDDGFIATPKVMIESGSATNGAVQEVQRSEKGARVYRKGFWSMNETMLLLTLKRQDNEKQLRGNERERNRTSAERWREIEEGCWARGVKKSSQQIKDKWDHLSADFKKVLDYENALPAGQKSYWEMTTEERREVKNMPLHFHLQVYQYMGQWMRKSKPMRSPAAAPNSLQHSLNSNSSEETENVCRKKRRLAGEEDEELKDRVVHTLEKIGHGVERALRDQIDAQKQMSQAQIDAQKQISQAQIEAQKQITQTQLEAQKQLLEVQMQQGKEFVTAMYAMVGVLSEIARR